MEAYSLAEHALVIGSAHAALIEALGMHAENMQRAALGQSMAYTQVDFQNVINNYGIGHNDLVEAKRRIL